MAEPCGVDVAAKLRQPESATMACPACTRTRYHVIDRSCPVCAGTGTLRLGAPALAYYPPETVAHAVSMALESLARTITTTTDLSADRRRLLTAELGKLGQAGLIDAPTPAAPLPSALTSEELAEHATGQQLSLFDIRVSDTGVRAFEYHADDRPRARGLPVLSASGHPSNVAMICDPADPFGDTRTDHMRQKLTHRQATVLREAANDAARRRARRRISA